MTKFDYAMHAVGVVALVGAGGLSSWIILKEMIPNRRRIMAAYRGEALFPAPAPTIVAELLPAEPLMLPAPVLLLTHEVA